MEMSAGAGQVRVIVSVIAAKAPGRARNDPASSRWAARDDAGPARGAFILMFSLRQFVIRIASAMGA